MGGGGGLRVVPLYTTISLCCRYPVYSRENVSVAAVARMTNRAIAWVKVASVWTQLAHSLRHYT